MIYSCCDDLRRAAVGRHATLMGIDYLEVSPDQQQLHVHFVPATEGVIKTISPPGLTAANIKISGGERITRIRVSGDPENEESELVVTVDDDGKSSNGVGDFSTYRLELVDVPDLDPLLSAVDFSFKVECPSDFDCQSPRICPPEQQAAPEIDYLAKDYGSFRQLMLDRISLLLPPWKERNAADVGIVLVELLAYVGDYLSYSQDAVATEAYLGTARRRTSVRRLARLVDYFMHDGSNARVWVHVRTSGENTPLEKGTLLLTNMAGEPKRIAVSQKDAAIAKAHTQRAPAFETMHYALLHRAHNEMHFYTWSAKQCCLPKGSARAVLKDDLENRLRLRAGDVLIFEERLGPNTGGPTDADKARRHTVRLTHVNPEADQVLQVQNEVSRTPATPVIDILTGQAYVEIEWHPADALPFPLCISAVTDLQHGLGYTENVSVAFGNIVLADHGTSVEETFDPVPQPDSRLVRIDTRGNGHCDDADRKGERDPIEILPRYRPQVQQRPLTQAATVTVTRIVDGRQQKVRLPFDAAAPAAAAFQWKMEEVLPAINLNDKTWLPRRDLLLSDKSSQEFVVEVEADETASLRFGDNQNGLHPETGTKFTASYRIGSGIVGNVGAETISHIVTSDSAIESVRNPLPARGGTAPESIEFVRQNAPSAFRRQERAVTPDDYTAIAQRHPEVQRAAATFRWTGSWQTVFLTVDRMGGLPVDGVFEEEMRRYMEPFRMAGYDLEVDGPRYVSLEIDLHVCVRPEHFRGSVKTALLEVFSNRNLPDGRRGVFHTDSFSFGEPVYLSRLIAAAQAVAGVESARLTTFQRQGRPRQEPLNTGRLELGRLEIARLDNDPNFPERGVFNLILDGGK